MYSTRSGGAQQHKRFPWICFLGFTLLALTANSGFSLASDGPDANLIFILDASGSMAAKVQGRPKIDVAKEVLSGIIKDLPAKTNVGLVVYGHRQKGDCTDVEELSPLAPVDKEALMAKIKGITPKGMTPITYSVQKVAQSLKNQGQESTIVLVSDGEETCKGDPCALVKELKASGTKFVMHVIGFDVNEKEKQQLSCIARAGDGSYFTARNAGELGLAARKVVQKEKEQKPATLTVKALMNGKPFRAYCAIYRGDGDSSGEKQKAAEGWTESGSKVFQLAPGNYDLRVESRQTQNNQAVDFKAVTVEPGKNVDKTADFSGGNLKVKALRNGSSCKAYTIIYKTGAGEEKVTEGWAEAEAAGFKLAPGVYDAVVEDREDLNKPSVTLPGISIEAGKTIEKVVQFSGGTLKIKALLNDKPFRAYCVVYKAQEEENEKEKVSEGWIEAETTSFKLTAGPYDVVVENQEDVNRSTVLFTGVRIEAAKTVEKVADFSGGTLKVKAQRNGKPLSALCKVYRAEEAEGEERSVFAEVWTGVEGAVLKLKPGVYDIIVENREDANGTPAGFKGITIELGKSVEKVADFSGGSLKVKAVRNGKPFSALCSVSQDKGEEKIEVASDWTREDAAVFKLAPGTYDLVVENREDVGSTNVSFQGITIEAGKTVEKQADFSGGSLKVKAVRNGNPFSALCSVSRDKGEEKIEVASDWTREDAAVFKLAPGAYDLVVENREDVGSPSVSFQGITVEAGKTVEKQVDFSGGSLKVKALRNGRPFSALCSVSQDKGEKKIEVASDWTREDAAVFKLAPGAYDLVVEDREDVGSTNVSFQGITIEGGKTVEKQTDFSGGTLKIKALRNGRPFSALCSVSLDKGEEKIEVASDWTREDAAVFKLVPGAYDLVVEDREDVGSTNVSFRGITIEGGKTVEKQTDFPGGTIKIKALRNGRPFSAQCDIYQANQEEEKKPIASDWTREEAAVFKLAPGSYEAIVQDTDSHEKKEFKGINLEPAKARDLEANF
jgi:Ca-activated chloride channel family protein